MTKTIRNSILSILILGMICCVTLAMLNDAALLKVLQYFSDHPKISTLVASFQQNICYFIGVFTVAIGLFFWKIPNQISLSTIKPTAITKLSIYLLATILLGGAIVRLNLLFLPITYDEAFTYNQYASQRWSAVLSSYTYPNNQIFHTILAKLSTQVFGISEWALRLPSFLFSMGSILLAFLIGRSSNTRLGLMFAFTLAFTPILVDYGALARGYSIVLFLGLLLWKLSNDWQQKDRVGASSQLLFITIAALAIWTIPVAILPIGLVLLKLRKFIHYQFIIKLIMSLGILTMILYAPVIILFGWTELVSYPSMPQANFKMLFTHHIGHGIEHLYYVYVLNKEVFIVSIGFGIYPIFKNRSFLKEYLNIGIVIVLFLLFTRVDPPARVWLIILPFIYFPILKHSQLDLMKPSKTLKFTSFIVVGVILFALILLSTDINVMRDFRMTTERDAVEWMHKNKPNQRLKSSFPSDAGIRWYESVMNLQNSTDEEFLYLFLEKSDHLMIHSKVITEIGDYLIIENADSE